MIDRDDHDPVDLVRYPYRHPVIIIYNKLEQPSRPPSAGGGGQVIKLVFSWKNHPDKSAEECDEHYRRVHTELAREAFRGVEGFGGLVYNRVTDAWVNDFNQPARVQAEPIADAWVELYFQDRATLEAAFQRPNMHVLFDDHPNFMAVDGPSNIRVYEVEELAFAGTRPAAGTTEPGPASGDR
ncbi:MAG: EthD domain-containing protein [Actinobacteria bacterium]|nr:EthD domain-containing protein [Actinomycetota bacterium]